MSQGGFDGENSRSASSFGTRSAYRGTVALKTLRRPKVKTLRQAYTTVGTSSFTSQIFFDLFFFFNRNSSVNLPVQ